VLNLLRPYGINVDVNVANLPNGELQPPVLLIDIVDNLVAQ